MPEPLGPLYRCRCGTSSTRADCFDTRLQEPRDQSYRIKDLIKQIAAFVGHAPQHTLSRPSSGRQDAVLAHFSHTAREVDVKNMYKDLCAALRP